MKNRRLLITISLIILVLIVLCGIGFVVLFSPNSNSGDMEPQNNEEIAAIEIPSDAEEGIPAFDSESSPDTSSEASLIPTILIISESTPDGEVQLRTELSTKPLVTGTMQFRTPAVMVVHQQYTARLEIDPNSQLAEILEAYGEDEISSESENLLAEEIPIYPLMAASLTGSGFEIVAQRPERQPFVGSGKLVWLWTVSPQRETARTLYLNIAVPVQAENDPNLVHTLKEVAADVVVELPPPTIALTPVPAEPVTPVEPESNSNLLILLVVFVILGISVGVALFIFRPRKTVTPQTQVEQSTVFPLFCVLDVFYSDDELRDLCLMLEEDYEDLPAEGQEGKARELVLKYQRDGKIPRLEAIVKEQRPQLILLHQLMRYDDAQVQALCDQLGINFDSISQRNKGFGLILRCQHRNLIEELTHALEKDKG